MRCERTACRQVSCRYSGTIAIEAAITSILADFVTLASASEIHLERGIVDPASIDADAIAVPELLSILIDNAIRYSSRGSMVTVRLSLTANQPRIDVMDSGPGIPDDVMPFIYNRFFRAARRRLGEAVLD